MKKIHKLTISALLIAAAATAGILIYMNRSTLPAQKIDRGVDAPRSTVFSDEQVIPVEKEPANISGQANDEGGGSSIRKAPANKPAALILNSEKSLVAEIDGNQGIDVRVSTSLMMGKKFGDFMERLSLESSSVPLARDITDLYTHAADEANAAVDNSININIACGMVVCGVSATAPTKDAFEAWFKAFVENQSARPNAAGRYDMVLDNGSVEYRIIFSTDPQKNQVIAPSN
ncbi:hypothetical protein [Dokdonella sp.]|uniref:hypothetical protein n=1 Tax=Dokdonella sp. TaxID=2291710 RepID=UPI001B0665BB|nr:hypothetical protein [Dokdonella sp.]MBO9662981.1 hypothetical protein [Dokdonella sp.]